MTMKRYEAIKIAGDYRDVLDSRECRICDTKLLPHDKEKIKEALTLILNCNDDICKALHGKTEEAYYLLADFQYFAGEDIRFPSATDDISKDKDITLENMIENNKKLLKIGNKLLTYKLRSDKFEPLINRERRYLKSDLVKMGFLK